MTTTINHISDSAIHTKFDPSGTDWPEDITNVQSALGKIPAYANKDVGLPKATELVEGIASIASEAEARTGTDTRKIITPATLNHVLRKPEATETVLGTVRLATQAEALTGTDAEKVITAKTLQHVTNNRQSTESVMGTARVATNTQATTGTDDKTIMTPKKVKHAIATLAPSETAASETATGVVRLATTAEVQQGRAREGVAISPYQFAQAKATPTFYGTFKEAGNTEMAALTSAEHAVTPKALGDNKGSTTKFGIVKLSATPTSAANTALASTAQVLMKSGGSMTGSLSWSTSNLGLNWYANSYNAHIKFISSGGTSRLQFDSDGYFQWTNGSTQLGKLNSQEFTVNTNRINMNGDLYARNARVLTQGLTAVWLGYTGGGLHTVPSGTIFVSGFAQQVAHGGGHAYVEFLDASQNRVYYQTILDWDHSDDNSGWINLGFQCFVPANARYMRIVGGISPEFRYALKF